MANFYASKEWIILFPSDVPEVKKAAGDLSRYIGLLAGRADGSTKPPVLLDAHGPAPSAEASVIVLNCERSPPQRNGFSWRVGSDRIEIYGESGRGLCNGIYSFLAALGISWSAPGQETLPSPQVTNLRVFPVITAVNAENADNADGSVFEPSHHDSNLASASWRRFIPSGKKEVDAILKDSEAFVAWVARRRYDALIFPLAVFASRRTGHKIQALGKIAAEYGITLEAGGRELSALLPRRFFLLHRDFFRMDEGRRKNDHHFCATNPSAVGIIAKEGAKLFRAAAGVTVFHLWPDKVSDRGALPAVSVWCSCPTCRMFTSAEQNRIGVNAAADSLAAVNPDACIAFFEKPGEGGNIPLRPNIISLEKLPDEKDA